MEINISINGVLRNLIHKIEYHYENYYLDQDVIPNGDDDESTPNDFKYDIVKPIINDKLLDSFLFQSINELEHFLYIEFPLEIFGHSPLSYPAVMTDLNKFIHDHKELNFNLIGVDELGKAKPATLFFLSKNGFLGNNIKFISSDNINIEWKMCDIWVTDDSKIINSCPEGKIPVKFNTPYNEGIITKNEINKINDLELCLKSLEKTISST